MAEEVDRPALIPEELVKRALHTIAVTQRLPEEKVTLDNTFENLGIDSLDGINIVFALEEEFDISIPDEDARSVRSVHQMVEGVARLVAAKAASDSPAQS